MDPCDWSTRGTWSRRVAASLLLALTAGGPLYGQMWSSGSGGAIYYNGGNVGIATSAP